MRHRIQGSIISLLINVLVLEEQNHIVVDRIEKNLVYRKTILLFLKQRIPHNLNHDNLICQFFFNVKMVVAYFHS